MREFDRLHPAVLAVYFLAVLVVLMGAMSPVVSAIALVTGIIACSLSEATRLKVGDFCVYSLLIIIMTIVNPMFSHNGVTALFYMNANAVTLEALLYGIFLGVTLTGVILWCRVMSASLSSDKIMFLIGRPFPKVALVLSMSLRFVPLLKRKAQETILANKAAGLYSSGSFTIRLRESLRTMSSVIGWAMENAIETSTYMQIRGYGAGARTSYSDVKFVLKDGIMLIVTAAFGGIAMFEMFSGRVAFSFYPEIILTGDIEDVAALAICVFMLCLLPCIINVEDKIRWLFCVRKI